VGIAVASISGGFVSSVLLITRFEGSLAAVARNSKRYLPLITAFLAVGGLYLFYLVDSDWGMRPIGVARLVDAALIGELGVAAVIYLVRSEWLAALSVVRERPAYDAATVGALPELEPAE